MHNKTLAQSSSYLMTLLTLMLQLGVFPPRRTIYPVALKPLRIVTKAFVTFPEYIWAKNAKKIRYLH